ncbi:ABC transporter permease [Brevibacterium litoralis]|uniref:ABC transporter permease n=1 Tax=Brevibacterium litoralis TaxID=3138935 RepID=UPI0032EE0727
MSTDPNSAEAPTPGETPAPGTAGPQASFLPRYVAMLLSQSVWVPIGAVVIALLVGGVLIVGADEGVRGTLGYFFARPTDFFATATSTVLEAYGALFRGSVFDWQASSAVRAVMPFTETLVAATPLILTGLGIALAFRSGLFNIGGQGQVVLGITVGGFAGYAFGLPPVIAFVVALLAGALGGAVWGGIAGVLKARTGANEVIVTIMLNSIAGFLLAYLLKQGWYTHTESANPASRQIDAVAELPALLPAPFRLHLGFLLAIAATVLVWWILSRSTLGFELRAVGENPHAARTAGISVGRVTIIAMLIAGALSGIAGASVVLGTDYKVTAGVAGSIGFDAITVALLGRSKPLGTFFAGLLFGAFKAGGYLMQSATGTPIDIILVVQSIIVLLIAAPPLVVAIWGSPARLVKRLGRGRRTGSTEAKEVAA